MARAAGLAIDGIALGALLFAILALAACGDDESASGDGLCRGAPGTLGCDCRDDHRCEGSLECLSGKCVGDRVSQEGHPDAASDASAGRDDAGGAPRDAAADAGDAAAADAECPECAPDAGCGNGPACATDRVCVDGECVEPFCGDGVVMGSERCDNGSGNSSDAYGVGECTDRCRNAPYCGDAALQPNEDCDRGEGNLEDAYGEGTCTTECHDGGTCGDGARNGDEQCDGGPVSTTELGACNPECTGFYERKEIRLSVQGYSTDLGGPAGADAKCQAEFGADYKALLVGGERRATITPFAADGQQDWVIAKYSYYYNADGALVWRTDDVPLLGVQAGARVDLLAPAYTPPYAYPWSGYANDWTTIPDYEYRGTCNGWTVASGTGYASFVYANLQDAAGEPCGSSSYIVCVEQ